MSQYKALYNNIIRYTFFVKRKHHGRSIFPSKNKPDLKRKFIEGVFCPEKRWCSPSISAFFLFIFLALECASLPKKVQGRDLSSRHSNAARVSENIRPRRRAAIFAASVSDAIFSARPRRNDFSPQNWALRDKMVLVYAHVIEWLYDAWTFHQS